MTIQQFIDENIIFDNVDSTHPRVRLERYEIYDLLKKFTELKCKETARNTRYKCIDIITGMFPDNHSFYQLHQDINRDIMNIQNQDVIPEL